MRRAAGGRLSIIAHSPWIAASGPLCSREHSKLTKCRFLWPGPEYKTNTRLPIAATSESSFDADSISKSTLRKHGRGAGVESRRGETMGDMLPDPWNADKPELAIPSGT